jgi:hypothetical protein
LAFAKATSMKYCKGSNLTFKMRPQRINSEKSCSINPRKWQSSKPSKRSRYMN